MPLHLLGKKSWNVYNPENIARVQRDEAQAKAREEEDERRMQEIDAERRIQILRGERPPIPPPPPLPQSTETALRRERTNADGIGAIRKRRRLAGEDDTDRDIRIAQEDAAQTYFSREKSALTTRRGSGEMQAPLMDSAGHINLFPATSANRKVEKNVEAEAETARQERSYEDQYTMRFSNAAGFKQSAGRNPWYSSAAQDASASDSMPQKDVWGNEDPMRKERERTRLDMNDPLAAMKRGVRQLKATEQQRKQWNEEKQKELEVLATEERHSRSSYRRRRSPPVGRLEDFQLDALPNKHREGHDRRSSRHHRHRDRSRSRDRSIRRTSHKTSHRHRHHRESHSDTRRSSKS